MSKTDGTASISCCSSRKLQLALFSMSNLSNALLWVTFSPISNIVQNYLGSKVGNVTNVNMLAVVFQIFYPPGTILGVLVMKRYGVRGSMLLGVLLTVIGALLRVIGTGLYEYDHIDATGVYFWLICGQILASIAQPFFVNVPAAISSIWFPMEERDMATTIGSLCSPLGNAIGQILPILFVVQSANDDDQTPTKSDIHGMATLMIVEFIINCAMLLLVYAYFEEKPAIPPSHSVLMRNAANNSINVSTLWQDIDTLMKDKNYLILFMAFSIGLGIFNSMINLINQLIFPQGYSNDDAGTFGMVLIVCGLVGAGIIGVVLEKTRAYRTILKVGFAANLAAIILWCGMLRSNNYAGLLFAFCLLGFCILPMLPTVLENCAEVTYPMVEDLPVGILFVGGNVLSIGLTFALQALISKDSYTSNPPLLPANALLIGVFSIAAVLLFTYNGEYKRLKCEQDVTEGYANSNVHERLINSEISAIDTATVVSDSDRESGRIARVGSVDNSVRSNTWSNSTMGSMPPYDENSVNSDSNFSQRQTIVLLDAVNSFRP